MIDHIVREAARRIRRRGRQNPEMVVEITYLTWTEDDLLRHTVCQGVREDKPERGGAPAPKRAVTVACELRAIAVANGPAAFRILQGELKSVARLRGCQRG